MCDILECRLLVSKLTKDVPYTKRDLTLYIDNIIREVENEIKNVKPVKLDDYVKYVKYEGAMEDINIFQVVRNYYMINGLPSIMFYLLDKETFNTIKNKLGLRSFKGSDIELLDVINAQAGQHWDVKRASKVCLLSYDHLTQLTNRSYTNSILSYAGGYYIDDDDRMPDIPIEDILVRYVSLYLIPTINDRNDDTRPTRSITANIADNRGLIKKYLDKYYINDYSAAEYMDRMGMSRTDVEYFISSAYYYLYVDKDIMEERPSAPIRESLMRYSDKAILEALETQIVYNDRKQLIDEAVGEFNTFKWSMDRKLLCDDKNKVLTRGRVLDYECYDPYDLWPELEEDQVNLHRGLIIRFKEYNDPDAYVTHDELDSLISSLIEQYPVIANVIEDRRRYIENIQAGNYKLLMVYNGNDKTLVSEEIYKDIGDKYLVYKRSDHRYNKDWPIYELNIDYITDNIAKIDNVYISPDTRLDAIRKLKSSYYNFVVYDKQLTDDELITIYEAMDSNNTKLYLSKRYKPPSNMEKYFKDTKSTSSYYVYNRINIDAMKYYLGDNWRDNWNVVNIRGDGDCMYHSISKSLGKSSGKELRRLMISLIPSPMPEKIKSDILQGGESVKDVTDEEARKRYSSSNEWGTTRTMKMLAKHLDFTPIIISTASYVDSRQKDVSLCSGAVPGNIVNSKSKLENIILLHQSGGHYSSIENKRTGKLRFNEDDLPEFLVKEFKRSCLVAYDAERKGMD